MVQQHKTCTTCGETKPLDGFYRYNLTQCKACQLERARYIRRRKSKIDERLLADFQSIFMVALQYKTCSKCKKVNHLNDFWGKRDGKHGVYSQCVHCSRESASRRHEQNRDQINAKVRRNRKENGEKIRSKARRRYRENAEKINEQNRARYMRDREKLVEQKRRYNEVNRESINEKMKRNGKELQELSEKFVTVPPRTPYHPGEDALILADNGMTVYQKAIELGRTFSSVKGRRVALLAKLNA